MRLEPVNAPRLYTCDADVQNGQLVVVEEEKCLEAGVVVREPGPVRDSAEAIAGKILRVATEDDRVAVVKNNLQAKHRFIEKIAPKHGVNKENSYQTKRHNDA